MTRIAFQLLTDLSDTKIIGKPAYESSESNTLYQPISEQRNYELKTANKILMWITANILKAVVPKKKYSKRLLSDISAQMLKYPRGKHIAVKPKIIKLYWIKH